MTYYVYRMYLSMSTPSILATFCIQPQIASPCTKDGAALLYLTVNLKKIYINNLVVITIRVLRLMLFYIDTLTLHVYTCQGVQNDNISLI